MRRNQMAGLGLAAVGLFAVVGCEQAADTAAPLTEPTIPVAEAAPVSATYVCDSGLTVAVAYPDAQSAQVTYRDRIYALRGAPAASGARYADSEVEWRTLTRDGVERGTLSRLVAEDAPVALERCSRPAPAAPAIATTSEAAPPAVPASAAGGASSVPAPCKGPQLKLSAEEDDAGAGNRVVVLGVQNVGAAVCSLTGYPGVMLQDRQGRDLTGTSVLETPGSYFRTGQTPTPVHVEPRGKAFFDIAWTVAADEGEAQRACSSAARIRMTAPGDTSPVSLDRTLAPCGGRVRVGPFRPVAQNTSPPAPAS